MNTFLCYVLSTTTTEMFHPTLHQKLAMLAILVVLFLFILSLVLRHKIAEEYSLLWLFAIVATFMIVIWFGLLDFLTRMIGAVAPTTTVFISSILFLLALQVQYSIVITSQRRSIRKMASQQAILVSEVKKLQDQIRALESGSESGQESSPESGEV